MVWGKSTIANKLAIKALDRTLQNLRGNNRPMGRVVFLMAGHFRQTLLVIPKEQKLIALRSISIVLILGQVRPK